MIIISSRPATCDFDVDQRQETEAKGNSDFGEKVSINLSQKWTSLLSFTDMGRIYDEHLHTAAPQTCVKKI